MEIFGIGPMELILILIVALMVFGPDKLPQIGAKLGRAMRDMRRATRAISDEINATRAAVEAPARELAEPFQEVAGLAKAARNPGAALRDSVLKELNPPAQATARASEAAGAAENTIAPPRAPEATPPTQAVISVDTPALTAAQESVSATSEGEERAAPLETPPPAETATDLPADAPPER